MPLTLLPAAPDPVTMTPAEFSAAAAAFVLALRDNFVPEFNEYLGAINALTSGTAISIPYTFSTTTTDANPGAGFLRLNEAFFQEDSNQIFISAVGSDGQTRDAELFNYMFGEVDTTVKGEVVIQSPSDPTAYIAFSMSNLVGGGGSPQYHKISVQKLHSPSPSPFANGDDLILKFTRAGNAAPTRIPQNSKSADYTLTLNDAGDHIYHPTTDATARTWTIPANASVAYTVGTTLTFVNEVGAGAITIAINADTLVLAGAGTTGSRTLAAAGIATAIKVTSTRWMISGTGLS